MRIQFHHYLCWLAALMLLAALNVNNAHAAPAVSLRASKSTLLADGKQQTELFVNLQGAGLTNSVEVTFTTTKGTLRDTHVRAYGGVAHTTLTSSPVVGIAEITAFIPGAVSNTVSIEFTDDPEATFEGNNYMLITAKGYLAYSATDKVIEAQGKDGGTRLTFRNFELTADRLRLECNDHANIRASGNVTFRRGKNVIHGLKLNFSLANNEGQAIAEIDGKLQAVKVGGSHLTLTPDALPAPSSRYIFPDLQIKLVINANSITYFPGDRLQFHRARFFQDQAKILELPYYELALNSDQLFSDHFISVGTRGFGLDLPFYYNLTPTNSGIIDVHHGQQVGRSFFATNPGFGVDVMQGYSAQGDKRFEGAYGFTNLLSSNWDFRWQHSQLFGSNTQTSMYVDFPHHDSVFANTNISQQTKTLRYGLNVSESQAFTSDQSNTFHNDIYVETQPHRLLHSNDFNYVVSTSYSTSRFTAHDVASIPYHDTSEQVSFRAYTRPFKLDTRTTLTNSFSAGQLWDGPTNTGVLGLATLSLDHTLSGGGAINLTYDFATRPQHILDSGGKHRVSLAYNVTNNKHVQLSVFGSTYLDAADSSLFADAAYRLNKDWRILTQATIQRSQGQTYKDLEFTLGRRIGARELELTYSTYNKRISFDLTATHF